jgi:hypothetical protein
MRGDAPDMWDCPVCGSLKRLPYGKNCPNWDTHCPNWEHAHVTGKSYLKNKSIKPADTKGVGISEIADDGEKGM